MLNAGGSPPRPDPALDFLAGIVEVITLVQDDKKAKARLQDLHAATKEQVAANAVHAAALIKAAEITKEFDASKEAAEAKEKAAQEAWETGDRDLAQRSRALGDREREVERIQASAAADLKQAEELNDDSAKKFAEMQSLLSEATPA